MGRASSDDRPLVVMSAASARTYARVAGILLLVSLASGGFGEFYVLSTLMVSGDATATAHNLTTSQALFRWGFVGYLIEAVCDVSLTLLFYALLRPVHGDVARLAVLFRIMSTATFAIAEFFYFAASLILSGAPYLKTFSPDQLNALALLSLRLYGRGGLLFLLFYGVASILLGYLIVRSGYLPKALGALLALGGAGFVAMNFLVVLAPAHTSDFFLLPTTLAMLLLALWFLVRGVDVEKWDARS